jgi:hypothetical protein
MRICVCGAQSTGKSTFVQDFVQAYPMYKISKTNYRDLIKSKGLALNKEGSQESQDIILNSMLDECMNHTSTSNVIYDRGTIDNIVHTMWLREKYPDRITEDFVRKSAAINKQACKFYDIILYIPITKYDNIPLESKENRDIDPIYRQEIDNLFFSLIKTYHEKRDGFFDMRDCPAIIEIFGSRQERIQMAKFYIDPNTGNQYDEQDNLITKAF